MTAHIVPLVLASAAVVYFFVGLITAVAAPVESDGAIAAAGRTLAAASVLLLAGAGVAAVAPAFFPASVESTLNVVGAFVAACLVLLPPFLALGREITAEKRELR